MVCNFAKRLLYFPANSLCAFQLLSDTRELCFAPSSQREKFHLWSVIPGKCECLTHVSQEQKLLAFRAEMLFGAGG